MTAEPDREPMFPVLWPYQCDELALWERMRCPRRVPWSLVEPHEKQADINHGQTLKRLAERGGLAPCEMLAVIEDRRWRAMPDEESIPALLAAIEAHRATPRTP